MSRPRVKRRSPDRGHASVFAALGDETRLTLVGRLSSGPPQSISRLARGSRITRQAITKHLRVLEHAGVVHSVRVGREQQFAFRPAPLKDAQDYLARVSDQWDRVLLRLKAFVES
jgi:DNA-binding transcriptional ArsR family regulator